MKSLVEVLKQFFIQRVVLYGAILFFSFFVIVPLGDLRLRFTDGHCSRCLLYSDVTLNTSSTPALQIHEFGEQEVCEYNLAMASVFSLFYPICAGLVYLHMYRKDSQETRDEKKIDLATPLFLGHVVVEVAVTSLHLVIACMVSRGFDHLCEGITGGGLDSCSDAQDLPVWGPYDGSNFFVSLSVATAGCWFLFVSWLAQSLLALWKLWRMNMLPVLSCLPCCKKDLDL